MVVLIVLERGLTPSPGSTPGKLSTAVWVRRTGLPSLDPMGMTTHPREVSRRVRRHCRDDEIVVEREGSAGNEELTEPMVDVISKVTVDCLDPGGNIDKESRTGLVHQIRPGTPPYIPYRPIGSHRSP